MVVMVVAKMMIKMRCNMLVAVSHLLLKMGIVVEKVIKCPKNWRCQRMMIMNTVRGQKRGADQAYWVLVPKVDNPALHHLLARGCWRILA